MKIKALLVEDDPKLRLLFQRLLEKNFDMEVVTALNGVEGLSLTHSEKPSIVFLDIDMPVMNGLEYLEAIRSEERTKDLYVVMMTATNEQATVKKILELGILDYILKSDRFDHLTKRIHNIIDKYKDILLERTRKNLLADGNNVNNKIVILNRDEKFMSKFREKFGSYCEIHTGKTGPDLLSLYLQEKPAYVILYEGTEILNEIKVLEKIRQLDIEKLTDVIILYESYEYNDADKFDYRLKMTEDIEHNVKEIHHLIDIKIIPPAPKEDQN